MEWNERVSALVEHAFRSDVAARVNRSSVVRRAESTRDLRLLRLMLERLPLGAAGDDDDDDDDNSDDDGERAGPATSGDTRDSGSDTDRGDSGGGGAGGGRADPGKASRSARNAGADTDSSFAERAVRTPTFSRTRSLSHDAWRDDDVLLVLCKARLVLSDSLASQLVGTLRELNDAKSYFQYIAERPAFEAVVERGPLWLCHSLYHVSGAWMQRVRVVLDARRAGVPPGVYERAVRAGQGGIGRNGGSGSVGADHSWRAGRAGRGSNAAASWDWRRGIEIDRGRRGDDGDESDDDDDENDLAHHHIGQCSRDKLRAPTLLQRCRRRVHRQMRDLRAPLTVRDVEAGQRTAAVAELMRHERALATYIGLHHELVGDIGAVSKSASPDDMEPLLDALARCSRTNAHFLREATANGVDGMERVAFSRFGAHSGRMAHAAPAAGALTKRERVAASGATPTTAPAAPAHTAAAAPARSELRRCARRLRIAMLDEIALLRELDQRTLPELRRSGALPQRPGHFQRHWLRYTLAVAGAIVTVRAVLAQPQRIATWYRGVTSALHAFWRDRIVEPATAVYRELFLTSYKTSMDPAVVRNERASLVHMLRDFSHATHRAATVDELAAFDRKAERGDLSPVMDVYERQIRKPLVNMVAGDVIRALLIQIQKLKVDVGEEMVAVDALVRANELNLEIMAAIPGVIVLGGGAAWLWRSVRRWRATGRKSYSGVGFDSRRVRVKVKARLLLRDIERILTRGMARREHAPVADTRTAWWQPRLPRDARGGARYGGNVTGDDSGGDFIGTGDDDGGNDGAAPVARRDRYGAPASGAAPISPRAHATRVADAGDFATQRYIDVGRMLLTLADLQALVQVYARELHLTAPMLRRTLLDEDVGDLKDADLTVAQKLRTVDRMRCTYEFLVST